VWAPSASAAVVSEAGQPSKASPSSEQAKLEPGSLVESSKLGVASLVGPDGPLSIAVSGGAVSTVQVKLAASASTLAAASVAWTEKV
jgi:hypothetical protein